MVRRLDYLGECNDQKVPLADFQGTFCAFCVQPECTRSKFGTSKFEQRVATWEERLLKAPRMAQTDPRFALITAKQFRGFNPEPSPTPSVSSAWLDPRDLPEGVQVVEEAAPDTQPERLETVPSEPETPVEVAPKPLPIQPPQPHNAAGSGIPTQLLGANAPNQTGRMLPGAPPPKPQIPEKDPWAAPVAPAAPTEGTVVKRGAKVRLGG